MMIMLRVQKFVMRKFCNSRFSILIFKRGISLVAKKWWRSFEVEVTVKERKGKIVEGSVIITKL